MLDFWKVTLRFADFWESDLPEGSPGPVEETNEEEEEE